LAFGSESLNSNLDLEYFIASYCKHYIEGGLVLECIASYQNASQVLGIAWEDMSDKHKIVSYAFDNINATLLEHEIICSSHTLSMKYLYHFLVIDYRNLNILHKLTWHVKNIFTAHGDLVLVCNMYHRKDFIINLKLSLSV